MIKKVLLGSSIVNLVLAFVAISMLFAYECDNEKIINLVKTSQMLMFAYIGVYLLLVVLAHVKKLDKLEHVVYVLSVCAGIGLIVLSSMLLHYIGSSECDVPKLKNVAIGILVIGITLLFFNGIVIIYFMSRYAIKNWKTPVTAAATMTGGPIAGNIAKTVLKPLP